MHNAKWTQWFTAAMVAVLITACGGGGADTTAPVITLNGAATMSVAQGATFTDPGATAVDAVDGNVAVSVSGSVDTATIGSYTLTYAATDAAGNAATKTRKVTVTAVADTTAPVVSLTGDTIISLTQFETFTDPGATATDDVDDPISVATTGTVDTDTPGTYTLTYTATDSAGNSAHINRVVTITVFNITANGTTYGAVKSPYTGKIFLDRNLGAARVCTAYNDIACYGDYYQWGRNFDGHEDQDSGDTATLAADIAFVGHSKFITEDGAPFDWAKRGAGGAGDDNGSKRVANWSKTDGSFVCPIGFRVPTLEEMKAELLDSGSAEIQKDHSQKSDNNDDRMINAYNTFLKLPAAGFRDIITAALLKQGTWGSMWLLEDNGNGFGSTILFERGRAIEHNTVERAIGMSVRCIKD